MTVFAAAIDALFADPNLGIDAVYRAGGADPGVPLRVIVRQPDRVGEFDETRIVTETLLIDIRVSEVAAPTECDTFDVGGVLYVIQGAPIRDAERLVWTVEARPALPGISWLWRRTSAAALPERAWPPPRTKQGSVR